MIMPAATKWACVCVALSILQGIFNLRFMARETIGQLLPNIVVICVIVVLVAAMAFRRQWACWIYIVMTAAGLVLFVMVFVAGFPVGGGGAVSKYLIAPLQLTPVRSFLQLISIIFLLTHSSRMWFSR
jgi:hypothetical protein